MISVKTSRKTEFIDITGRVQDALASSGVQTGICIVFSPHTTAGVTINEGADPSVKHDILMILNQMVPDKARYQHMEGNSPAHIKTTLTGSSVHIPVEDGKLLLGTWQAIFFCEYDGPRTRKVHTQFLGTDKKGLLNG